MHNLARTRSRSALLTTVIVALASTVLSVKPGESVGTVQEALRLHAHVDKLNLVVFASAAKSVDIIQAHIVSSYYTFGVPGHGKSRSTTDYSALHIDSCCRGGEHAPRPGWTSSVGLEWL